MSDLDYKNFQWLHWATAAQPLIVLGCLIGLVSGAGQETNSVLLTASLGWSLLGMRFLGWPRLDGTGRRIAEHSFKPGDRIVVELVDGTAMTLACEGVSPSGKLLWRTDRGSVLEAWPRTRLHRRLQ